MNITVYRQIDEIDLSSHSFVDKKIGRSYAAKSRHGHKTAPDKGKSYIPQALFLHCIRKNPAQNHEKNQKPCRALQSHADFMQHFQFSCLKQFHAHPAAHFNTGLYVFYTLLHLPEGIRHRKLGIFQHRYGNPRKKGGAQTYKKTDI